MILTGIFLCFLSQGCVLRLCPRAWCLNHSTISKNAGCFSSALLLHFLLGEFVPWLLQGFFMALSIFGTNIQTSFLHLLRSSRKEKHKHSSVVAITFEGELCHRTSTPGGTFILLGSPIQIHISPGTSISSFLKVNSTGKIPFTNTCTNVLVEKKHLRKG